MDQKTPTVNPHLKNWFLTVMRLLDRRNNARPRPAGTYYEFGTGWGGSLVTYFSALEQYCLDTKKSPDEFRVICFDSFIGLPKSDHPADTLSSWKEGDFANSIDTIKGHLAKSPFSAEFKNIRFVKGYFDQSLTPELRDELRECPPQIVNMDVDYYTSTMNALTWVQPILSSGTFFYFDDMFAFYGHPHKGQPFAINQFNSMGLGHLEHFFQATLPGQTMIYTRRDWEY